MIARPAEPHSRADVPGEFAVERGLVSILPRGDQFEGRAIQVRFPARASEIQPFPVQVMESVQRGVMDYSGRRGDADPDRTFMPAGQGLGLIRDVRPAGEIFRQLVDETVAAIGRLKPLA